MGWFSPAPMDRMRDDETPPPIKTLDTLDVSEREVNSVSIIEISTTARSYLHNQVRSFAGALKLAGEGKWSADDVRESLEARDRTACAPVAPAHGLYLISVKY